MILSIVLSLTIFLMAHFPKGQFTTVSDDSATLCTPDKTKSQLFYDGELSSTRYYEYDAQNRVQKITYYDKDGNSSMTIINQYDQFGNLIESTRECWKQGEKSESSTHLTYEIVYWE